MTSIRVFLVAAILAVITLVSFVAAIKGYSSSMEKANSLFDRQLQDTAQLIAHVHTADTTLNVDEESGIVFQIWQKDNLLASSLNAPSALIAPLASGFDYSNFNGYRWRTHSWFDQADQYWVVAADRTDLRFTLAENVVLESIFPVLLALPLIGLLIWGIVGQGLMPLRRLALELAHKQSFDLNPIPDDSYSKELKQIVLSSNKLLARLESALTREKQFASDAAHELRTPISALKVQLHNISRELPENSTALLELTTTAERLGRIVEQILDLYRSSPDKYNASLTSIDLNTLAQKVLAQEFSSFEAKNQKLEFQGQTSFISGDQFALTTLLQNLLGNANKYTPISGLINVSVEKTGGRVILKVEDSGPGIPEQEHEEIFQRFYRVGGDRHQSGEPGCGLGLAIVKLIVEFHDATISVELSSFPTGTAFVVSFPANETDNLAPPTIPDRRFT